MRTCIYSGKSFDSATGEHIIQNALGARWTSHEIVCNEVQDQFGRTIDLALAHGVASLRAIFGTKGGNRGDVPTLRSVSTETGDVVDVNPGLTVRLQEPKVEVIVGEDGREKVKFIVGDLRQIDWALTKAQALFPGHTLTKKKLLEHADFENSPPERLKIPIPLGGTDFFRGMLKSCFNLFGVNNRQAALDGCFDSLRNYVLKGEGTSDDFVEFLVQDEPLQLPQLGVIDHGIFIVQRGACVQGIMRYFGGLVFPFQLTNSFSGQMNNPCSYIVNPSRDTHPDSEKRNTAFSEDSIPVFASMRGRSGRPVQEVLPLMVSRLVAQHTYFGKVKDVISRVSAELNFPTPPTPEQQERFTLALKARLRAEGLVADEPSTSDSATAMASDNNDERTSNDAN